MTSNLTSRAGSSRRPREGRVTIATNMAGRGTDIKLGYGVEEIGGLHVIATEPHEARRVDRQLFGRAGRQGDPGSVSRHYSMDDNLFETYLPRWANRMLQLPANHQTGEMFLPKVCSLTLSYVQRQAEKLAVHKRSQVTQKDRQQRASLGFARD